MLSVNRAFVARGLVAALLAVLVTGCAFNPNQEFSGFQPERFGQQQVLVIVDTLKLDDVEGDQHVVNLSVNNAIQSYMIDAAMRAMAEKGYRASSEVVRSSGLMVGNATQYRVIDRGSEPDGKTDWDDNDIGSNQSAPYSVELGPLPESAIGSLFEVHQNFVAIDLKRFDEVGSLGLDSLNLEGYSGVLLLQGYGVDVPLGKSMAQGMMTAVLTLGMVAAWQQSTSNYAVGLLDTESGEVVWANRMNLVATLRDQQKVEDAIQTLLRDLPERDAEDAGERVLSN